MRGKQRKTDIDREIQCYETERDRKKHRQRETERNIDRERQI